MLLNNEEENENNGNGSDSDAFEEDAQETDDEGEGNNDSDENNIAFSFEILSCDDSFIAEGCAVATTSAALVWSSDIFDASTTVSYQLTCMFNGAPCDGFDTEETQATSTIFYATADGHYMLSRDLNQITLYDLTQLLPYRLPTHLELQHSKSSLAEQWRAAFRKNDEELQKSLNITLEELFKKSDHI